MIGQKGRTCSVPDCDGEPVLQWLRAGTPEEAAANVARLHAVQAQLVDYRRTSLTLEVADLADRQERLAEKVDVVTLKAGQAQLEQRQADLDAIEDPVRPVVEPVTVAVFGCEAHAVDLESAALLHEVGCLDSGPCGCTLPD